MRELFSSHELEGHRNQKQMYNANTKKNRYNAIAAEVPPNKKLLAILVRRLQLCPFESKAIKWALR